MKSISINAQVDVNVLMDKLQAAQFSDGISVGVDKGVVTVLFNDDLCTDHIEQVQKIVEAQAIPQQNQ
jgi:hypothetical protein